MANNFLNLNWKEFVDEQDIDFLRGYNWSVDKRGKTSYWRARINGKLVYMHRFLTRCPPEKVCDHIDGNGLNNKRNNLRICTRSQNNNNRKSRSIDYFKWDNRKKKWRARVSFKYKVKTRYFSTKTEAEEWYDIESLKIKGEYSGNQRR